ncbi:MAG: CBS domain-containing protein [Chlamydiae bacterium]|nr:CBS domain-containing protein [Chlamydiota bacterium]MBI3267267.1 CBS domain-containing protein [Chlamydiota bacterium]
MNTIQCPACGSQNLAGEDRCEQCFHSLMQRDLPRAKKDDAIQSVMMTAPILELLTGKDLLVASTTDTVQKIVKIFQKENKNCILVYKKKKMVGIISFRDLLLKVTGKIEDLSKVKAEAIMTPNPEYVRAEDPIAYAVNKMAMGGFRHLPVLARDGTPLSIIMIKDVLKYLSKRKEK